MFKNSSNIMGSILSFINGVSTIIVGDDLILVIDSMMCDNEVKSWSCLLLKWIILIGREYWDDHDCKGAFRENHQSNSSFGQFSNFKSSSIHCVICTCIVLEQPLSNHEVFKTFTGSLWRMVLSCV